MKTILKISKKKSLSEPIFFNSRSKFPINHLSNFYGGVEFEYQKLKFPQKEMKDLFDNLSKVEDPKIFREISDKYGCKGKHLNNGKPVNGILAKLVANMTKKSNKKRKKVIMEETGLKEIEINWLTGKEMKIEMKKIIYNKFLKNPYKDILLSTGDRDLHELAMRGKYNNWAYNPENPDSCDWLGKILMEVRNEIKKNY